MSLEVKEYVEKPKVSLAVRWDGSDYDGIKSFCKGRAIIGSKGGVIIEQSDGNDFILSAGDYVVEKSKGKFLCFKKEEFENRYEEVKYGC